MNRGTTAFDEIRRAHVVRDRGEGRALLHTDRGPTSIGHSSAPRAHSHLSDSRAAAKADTDVIARVERLT